MLAVMTFLYLAIGASGGALAFLAGQRMSGRTPAEVHVCNDQAKMLENVSRDLDALAEDVHKAAVPAESREELERARVRLDEAISGLRRGADLIV